MYTTEDYITWRGDIPFAVSPLNEVDIYILSKAGAPDFSGIVPKTGEELPFSEVLAAYEEKYGRAGDKIGALASPEIMPVLRRLPKTERFGALRVSRFVNIIDGEETEQFSALTLHLADGTAVVTFRGTDDHLLGWRENCYLASADEVAAQRDALEYLEEAAGHTEGKLLLAGHSKGGNLAVFAAVKASEALQERLDSVWCFDGPGFRIGFLDEPGYGRILPKLHTVLPEHCMVGTLLYRKERPEIVSCTKVAAMAHDGFCWETGPTGFVRAEGLHPVSEAYESAMRRTLIPMDARQRRDFTDSLFDILSRSGAETVTDLTAQGIARTAAMVGSLTLDTETRRFLSDFFENFVGELRLRGISIGRKSFLR